MLVQQSVVELLCAVGVVTQHGVLVVAIVSVVPVVIFATLVC